MSFILLFLLLVVVASTIAAVDGVDGGGGGGGGGCDGLGFMCGIVSIKQLLQGKSACGDNGQATRTSSND